MLVASLQAVHRLVLEQWKPSKLLQLQQRGANASRDLTGDASSPPAEPPADRYAGRISREVGPQRAHGARIPVCIPCSVRHSSS